jgi:hypothetical protein
MFIWAKEEESPMGMEVNPRSLKKGLLIFQDREHLKKLYMWKDSRQISQNQPIL